MGGEEMNKREKAKAEIQELLNEFTHCEDDESADDAARIINNYMVAAEEEIALNEVLREQNFAMNKTIAEQGKEITRLREENEKLTANCAYYVTEWMKMRRKEETFKESNDEL